jgi:L-iditol 2-dehydrogenase
MMKAVVKTKKGSGNVALCDVEEPKLSPGEVLVEIDSCGICGTDLHVRSDDFRNFPPVILGHEFVGRIVEEGSAVQGSTNPDARYAVLGATAVVCGKCDYCKSGNFMFCPDRRGMGHGVNGAMTRLAKVRPDQLFQLSESTPTIEGALVEPLAVAVAAVAENTSVRPGDVVLITGPGPIGLLCLQVLSFIGARTIVVGTAADAGRLELARELGAYRTAAAQVDPVDQIVSDVTEGRGVDVAFEVSGARPAVAQCLQALRPLGSYTQVGHFGREIQVPFDLLAFKQLRVQGTVGYTRRSWARAMRLMDQGMRPSRIVTHTLPLSQWAQGFDLFEAKDAVKVILQPDERYQAGE